MTKPTKWPLRSAKTQINLGIRPVWSESLLSAWRSIWSLATHWVHCKGSDQTVQMPRLIWVFAGRRGHFVGFVVLQLIWWCRFSRYFLQIFQYFILYQHHFLKSGTPWRTIKKLLITTSSTTLTEYSGFLSPITYTYLRKHVARNRQFIEPCHEKTCFSHMRTTKVQISLRIRAVWLAPLLVTT